MRNTLIALSALVLGSAYAVTLPNVDCAKDKANARCKFSSGNAGKVGTGLPFKLGGFMTIGSGFVDANENAVYVPVEFGGQQDTSGVIMKVDLKTGNRTVVSGYDGEQWVGKGVAYVSDRGEKSEAYDLGRVMVLRPGPAGSILALVDKGLQQRTEILKVDRKTGDRTLLWASKGANDAEKVRADAITQIEKNRFNFSSDALCRGGDKSSLKPSSVMETDGTNVYLFLANNPAGTGIGLVKVPLTGGSCTWISQYWPDGKSEVGSGNTVNTMSPLVFASGLYGSEFVGATGPNPSGNTLFAIDTKTGARRNISIRNTQVPARTVGKGDAELGYLRPMGINKEYAITLGSSTRDDGFDPIAVDLKTGERIVSGADVGSLSSGRDSEASVVAAIPGSNTFVVSFNGALHIWNGETGNSYVLSQ